MASRTLAALAALLCMGPLAGCTVVRSQAVPVTPGVGAAQVPKGIPYFLPRRGFLITVTQPTSGVPTIAVTQGVAEPDPTKVYVLSQGTNWLADNEFNITIGANGLLKSSTSTATSEVATAVQNLASTVGMVAPGAALPNPGIRAALAGPAAAPPPLPVGPNIACPVAGSNYTIILYPDQPYQAAHPLTLCSANEGGPYAVTWHRTDLAPSVVRHFGGDNELSDTATPVSGLFFRHELPYVITIRGIGSRAIESDTLITSPNESETDFFPVKRSFFANNTATITVTDGVITGVDQVTKSELAAALGLPATWISSYTTAVGQLFSGLTTVSADQQKYIQQTLATTATQIQASAVTTVQNQLCAKTVASYNLSTMSPTDLAAAVTAIKAACPTN